MNATLHMVTELNPDALKIAEELDAERKAGKRRGYVHFVAMYLLSADHITVLSTAFPS